MSHSIGMANHPALDQMEAMWRSGSRGKEILEYLKENDLPLVNYKTLSKYGSRNWNELNEELQALDSTIADIENYGLGKITRVSVSKTGYNISISPEKALEDDLSDLKRIKVGSPIKAVKRVRNQSDTIVVIPDTQVEPGRPNEHLLWASQYMNDFLPDSNVSVVHIGDHWNMGSLSSYDKGKGAMEGRRVVADLESGERGFELLDSQISKKLWDKHFLHGNHEWRLMKAIQSDIQLEGLLSVDNFITPPSWQRHDFLEVLDIEGISFSHYFYNPNTSKPYGDNVESRLKTIGRSFVMGHQQGLRFANRYIAGKQQIGLVCGSFYAHEENYMGPQGTGYWRGIVVLKNVKDGSADPEFVSLDQLCQMYTGKPLSEYELKIL